MKKFFIGTIFLFIVGAVAFAIMNNLPKIKFMGNDYYLKWSNPNASEGYINEYLRKDETFDDYHTMITVSDFPNVKNQLEAAKRIYRTFYDNVQMGTAVFASINSITDNSTLVRFCAMAQVPRRNLECSYHNVQQTDENSPVTIFQFTQRYYTDEVSITTQNFTKLIDDGFNEVRPHIIIAKTPDIVRRKIDAKSSYQYGIIKK